MTRLSLRMREEPTFCQHLPPRYLQINFPSFFLFPSHRFFPAAFYKEACAHDTPILRGAHLGFIITSYPFCAGARNWVCSLEFVAQLCTRIRFEESHNRPTIFKGLRDNMQNSVSRILRDPGFLLPHPTRQMFHALNLVSGSLWHFSQPSLSSGARGRARHEG